jgi:hypothetical protein
LAFCVLAISGCSEKTDKLVSCKDFQELNRNYNMNELLSLGIMNRGGSIYDSDKNKYIINSYLVSVYDSVSKTYISIPGFNDKIDLVEAFKNCDDDCKKIIKRKLSIDNGEITFELFKNYVQHIKKLYEGIKVPDYYPCDKIFSIKGSSYYRKITFGLNENIRVYYYFEPQPNLRGVKKDSTHIFVQLDDHWYCKYNYRTP